MRLARLPYFKYDISAEKIMPAVMRGQMKIGGHGNCLIE